MSAAAVGVRAVPPGRSAAWTPLIWVTWRQHRLALAGVLALLGGISLFLVINGLSVRSTYDSLGLAGCHPASSVRCQPLQHAFDNDFFGRALQYPRFLEFLPALIGAFIGAPLFAREFESGTFRFAWTQGAGRMRWVAVKLALLALATLAMALVFSEVFAWWYRPFEPFIARMMAGQAFEVEGVVFAARALFGFALGALAGAVIRRVVPALAATLAGWLAVVWPTVVYLRPHFRAPLVVQTSAASKIADWGSVWSLNQWWTGPDGRPVSRSAMDTLARWLAMTGKDQDTWLTRHHYTLWQSYQPGSRFWEFQAIEGVGLLTLSLLMAAATIWWVRRHAA